MKLLKFSIISPSYNQGRFIRDCIESVRAQSGVEWEHLVMDDGSTDETLAVLKEYPHLQWTTGPNQGPTPVINQGFRRATGDWVMWLNTDDYLLPGALAKVARFAEQHPEADVIYGSFHEVDVQRRISKTFKMFPFDLRMLIHYGCYVGSNACYFRKRTTLDEGFLLDPNFRYVMDGEYFARLGRAGKRFVYLPEVLACFRVHGSNLSLSHASARSVDEWLAFYKRQAETAAIRRAYGFTWFREPINNNVADAALWWFYRLKKIALKVRYRSYWGLAAGALLARLVLD